MDILIIENWLNIWGYIILLGLPILLFLTNRLHKKRKEIGAEVFVMQIVRFFLIPFLALHLILSKIVKLPEESTVLKTTETIITIILVAILLNAINILLLSRKNIFTSREILPKLGRDIVLILVISFISAFVLSHIWGFDLQGLLTALGVGSIVLGLALQEPLGNLFNGISLLMDAPIRKGDWVSIEGELGRAIDINWRAVKIHTRSNEEIIIPNNIIATTKIKNLSRPNKMFAEILEFGFSYDNTPEQVKKILLEVAAENKRVLKTPTAAAYTLSFDDFVITYGLKVFVEDFDDTIVLKDEILSSIYHASKENGLIMPSPKQDIELKNETIVIELKKDK